MRQISPALELPRGPAALRALPKGERRKVLLALLLRKRKVAPNAGLRSGWRWPGKLGEPADGQRPPGPETGEGACGTREVAVVNLE